MSTAMNNIIQALRNRDNFVVCGHTKPDGDSISSVIAIVLILKRLGKTVTGLLVENEPVPENLKFLKSYTKLVPYNSFNKSFDTLITVDMPSPKRMKEAQTLCDRAKHIICIDHHEPEVSWADNSYIDPKSASTTAIIWSIATKLGLTENASDIATCCYTGLLTDTGRFQYSNTDSNTFLSAASMAMTGKINPSHIAKLTEKKKSLAHLMLQKHMLDHMEIIEKKDHSNSGIIAWLSYNNIEASHASDEDLTGLIDTLRNIDGIDVACLIHEKSNGEVIGSIRSDTVDVSVIAHTFDGGGHTSAAGFTMHGYSIATSNDLISTVETLTREIQSAPRRKP